MKEPLLEKSVTGKNNAEEHKKYKNLKFFDFKKYFRRKFTDMYTINKSDGFRN